MKKGSRMTLKQRKRVSDGHKGQIAWNKGLTKESDNRMKNLSDKIKIANKEHRCGMYGKKQSEETKQKIGKANKIAMKLKWKDIEYRKHMSKVHIEFYKKYPEKHPNRIVASNNRMTYIEKSIQNVLAEKLTKNKFEHNYKIDSYFVDFVIFKEKLVIECDGEYWHSTKEAKRNDAKRQRHIEKQGWKFIRFTGKEIRNNLEKCKMMIYAELYGDI